MAKPSVTRSSATSTPSAECSPWQTTVSGTTTTHSSSSPLLLAPGSTEATSSSATWSRASSSSILSRRAALREADPGGRSGSTTAARRTDCCSGKSRSRQMSALQRTRRQRWSRGPWTANQSKGRKSALTSTRYRRCPTTSGGGPRRGAMTCSETAPPWCLAAVGLASVRQSERPPAVVASCSCACARMPACPRACVSAG
mmetsp:Transcript_52357/g.164455  ORF Transcript_52357/g.164455 Transcript_52357/m.164455 type:complete len:200 (+) Transcript_52357:377-976(+)